jgi:hypothetical protein
MGEIIFFGFRCQIAWRPSLFLIGTLEEHLIPIGPFFHLQYNFLTFKKKFMRYPCICFAFPQLSIGE